MIIFLTGMPGSGKTSIGQKLAEILNWPFYDTDQLIESREQKKITDIFHENGEDYFREVEHLIIQELKVDKAVVATGGGAPLFFDNMDVMKRKGKTVYLDVSLEVLKARVKSAGKRPLLAGDHEKQLELLYKKRLPIYRQADISVSGSDEEIIQSVLDYIRN